MQYEIYKDLKITEDFSVFEFSSIGKHETILKRTLFTPTELKDVYNIAFGDIDANG